MYVKTCCISLGSRNKRSVLCCSRALNICLGNGREGFASSWEAMGQVCREYLVSVTKVDLKLPRVWCCLLLSPHKSCFHWDFCVWNVWEIPPEQNWSGNGLTSVIRDAVNISLIFEIGIPSFPCMKSICFSVHRHLSFTRENIFLYEEDRQCLW